MFWDTGGPPAPLYVTAALTSNKYCPLPQQKQTTDRTCPVIYTAVLRRVKTLGDQWVHDAFHWLQDASQWQAHLALARAAGHRPHKAPETFWHSGAHMATARAQACTAELQHLL